MSEALVKTNSDFLKAFEKSPNKRCPHGYLRGAQDLAALLGMNHVFGARDHGWAGNSSGIAPDDAKDKQGIICYMNIPGYSGQGHIDLWNKGMPIGSEFWNAETIWLWKLP